ncbi:hypothetical protein A9179_13655 [Pseudomonas alcaligenes]|uniref:Prokaryotic YEATS domain-containing protein n=2 Tax=Aquipseudomonas alcaligenes TaxID=43263 RepID=A0ABR7S150_AQUAC|nr:hypothetical protein [Pseudomonas alcaligenes]
MALAALCALGALARILFSQAEILERIDQTTLLYLGCAGALLLLREAKSFSLGDLKVEFERIKEIAEQARQTAEVAEDAARYGLTAPAPVHEELGVDGTEIAPGEVSNDPWKGQFGGLAEAGGLRLSARVEPFAGSTEWFLIHLQLRAASPRQTLRGPVRFYLHPTFARSQLTIDTPPEGVIELRLKAWGAFTVGVLVLEENTRLELDLAELADAPAVFKSR